MPDRLPTATPVARGPEVVASRPPARQGKPPTDWRFVRRPWWVLSHLFLAACIITFVNLGLWQLRRLDERKAANHLIEQREAIDPAPLSSLITPTTSDQDAAPFSYRKVTVVGHYDNDNQVLIRSRDLNSVPGWWLITPLVADDGTAVAVNRGFVPYVLDQNGPLTEYLPPTGTVTVTGLVFPTQNRQGGAYDPADGTLKTLSRVDLHRYQRQLPYPIYPVYVNLQTSSPPQSSQSQFPTPIPPPELGEGPHLDYAGQWFIFAILTAIVYPLLLRRTARNNAIDDSALDDHDRDVGPSHPVAEGETIG